MGAINGKDFMDRLNLLKTEIWFNGKKVEGKISEHPAFKGVIHAKASLYDFQHDPKFKDEMTFSFPGKEEAIGLSYLQPKTKADLKRRRKMIEHWAKHTHGMMGRSPDYMNSVLMSFASSAALLKGRENCFPENIQALYERAMEQDLSFTHSFITPQVNRSQLNLEFSKEPISAKVVEKNEKGLVIKGARLLATQGGLTDEILVFAAPKLFFDPNDAFAFSIPSDTKGLKFICRESFVGSDSIFNHPLSSRFDEMDSIVVFDNVLVPWDRVFYYDDTEMAGDFLIKSSFYSFAYYQAIIRQVVKTEFILGVAELLVETINVSEYQHIQEKLSEIIIGLETMKALLDKSENDAEIDEWGYMRPNIIPLQIAGTTFPKIYPRFCEIIQLIGTSGMVSLPTDNDFDSPIKPELDKYLQAANRTAEDRVKLFRLAWDLTMSPFGTRQIQYERYFFGDPIRLSSQLYKSYSKQNSVDIVRQFLGIKSEYNL